MLNTVKLHAEAHGLKFIHKQIHSTASKIKFLRDEWRLINDVRWLLFWFSGILLLCWGYFCADLLLSCHTQTILTTEGREWVCKLWVVVAGELRRDDDCCVAWDAHCCVLKAFDLAMYSASSPLSESCSIPSVFWLTHTLHSLTENQL